MLTILKKIVQEVNAEPDLNQALARLVSRVKEAINTDCCTVYLADYEKQHFLLMATKGLSQEAVGEVAIGFSEGLVGLVGQREEPINIPDAKSHPRFKHSPEVKEESLNAFLGTPIIHHRRVLGVISVQQHESRQFTEAEEAFLVTLAAQLAAAIAHAEARNLLGEEDSKQHWVRNLEGVPASAGIAIGPVYLQRNRADLAVIALKKVHQSELEIQRFNQAVDKTMAELDVLAKKLSSHVNAEALDLFDMYKHLLSPPSMGNAVTSYIKQGWCAISALKLATDNIVNQFESMDDPYIRERAVDVKDLGNRVLGNILSRKERKKAIPDNMILVAQEVTASMLAELPKEKLGGIVSMRGSSNSHAAILARALAIPAVFGVEDIPLGQLKGQELIVDGYSGRLFLSPSDALKVEYGHLLDEEHELQALVEQQAGLPAMTVDQTEVSLQMNAGLEADFESVGKGAEGIGLYRTEFPFMVRSSFPSETEQVGVYQHVLKAFPEHDVTMRTLDVGGDKALPYFPINEDNPFLGWRGIRVTLDHPEIFLVQVRAMMRANAGQNNLRILLPMISCVDEVEEATRLINQAYFELADELDCRLAKPKVGVMVEVPSVIYLIDHLADKVDFLSVGSNDLTQYLLAVDRNNSRVANLYKPHHPAVLNALLDIAERAKRNNLDVCVCGEIAAEPSMIMLLLAMGYRSFSMSGHHINKIKWIIRNSSLQDSEQILQHCLSLYSPDDVQDYVNVQLEKRGLGGFIRAGK